MIGARRVSWTPRTKTTRRWYATPSAKQILLQRGRFYGRFYCNVVERGRFYCNVVEHLQARTLSKKERVERIFRAVLSQVLIARPSPSKQLSRRRTNATKSIQATQAARFGHAHCPRASPPTLPPVSPPRSALSSCEQPAEPARVRLARRVSAAAAGVAPADARSGWTCCRRSGSTP